MEISQLARKQKRLKDWSAFTNGGGVQDPALKAKILATLAEFKNVLTECWNNKVISSENEKLIDDLERRLEQFNEEARMTVVGKHPSAPARVI